MNDKQDVKPQRVLHLKSDTHITFMCCSRYMDIQNAQKAEIPADLFSSSSNSSTQVEAAVSENSSDAILKAESSVSKDDSKRILIYR